MKLVSQEYPLQTVTYCRTLATTKANYTLGMVRKKKDLVRKFQGM
jgi:hypothetical protein